MRKLGLETQEQQDIPYVSKVTGWSVETIRNIYNQASKNGMKIILK